MTLNRLQLNLLHTCLSQIPYSVVTTFNIQKLSFPNGLRLVKDYIRQQSVKGLSSAKAGSEKYKSDRYIQIKNIMTPN